MQINSTEIKYRLATQEDTSRLLKLINTQAVHDSDKIVILPKKFRSIALESGIKKNRYFIAEHNGQIIGYKKLFVMADEDEKADVLVNEIRCKNNDHNRTFAGKIDAQGLFHVEGSMHSDNCYNLCIYNGADFTVPEYRGKGINKQLTNTALVSLIDQVKKQMHENKPSAITMLYGITQANAGEVPGASSDRTPSIAQSFKFFLQKLENRQENISLIHHRYRAFKPSFDPESQECRPLADEYSIPGFGCVLTYELRGSYE
jgi:hypothetical protein